ncbi:MAG: hypothetical protein GY799_29425 [Desulfobulbaceae bacterium]|nr:hypothetical protein [Desulfobulbaceae bacterium]
MAYETDYDKHNARSKDEIRTEIMTTCFHVGVDAKGTSRILFSAGMKATKADIVQKFFDGRQRWLDQKAAARNAEAASGEPAITEETFDDDIPF